MINPITLNIDCGERGYADEIDLQFLEIAHVVNIALGGHAGLRETAQALAKRAQDAGVKVCLHPGYPDREHFGRLALQMPWQALETALDKQREILPDVSCVKFHGALYHAAMFDQELGGKLADWLKQRDITALVTMRGAQIEAAAEAHGIQLLYEGFADRRYVYRDGQLGLKPRDEAGASLATAEGARMQARSLCKGSVRDEFGTEHAIAIDTLCIHGDGDQALTFAKAVREEIDACLG